MARLLFEPIVRFRYRHRYRPQLTSPHVKTGMKLISDMMRTQTTGLLIDACRGVELHRWGTRVKERRKEVLQKTRAALETLASSPAEALDRLEIFARGRWGKFKDERPSADVMRWEDVVSKLEIDVGWAIGSVLQESRLREIEADVKRRMGDLSTPLSTVLNADFRLARLCYSLCVVLTPEIVIETGVASGVSSTFILEALAENGTGHLHSVDLPPLAAREEEGVIGALIPDGVRGRWTLHRGSSRKVLPRLLDEVGEVQLFLHDSLHTRQVMAWEFATVTPSLARPWALVADDVHNNKAFDDWVAEVRPQFSAVVKEVEKPGHFGVAAMTQP